MSREPVAVILPAEPSPSLLERLPRWLVEGNPAVKVGVLLLLMGVAFLLKYAAQYVRFPVEMRYLAVLAGAAGAITFGWRQREHKPVFAHALQGGGLGIAFLAIFAAFRLHGLLPAGAAFALLAGMASFSAALALAQSAQALAIIGLAGGFLAPILASTGQGSHVVLFGYYALLNLGIAAVARARAWRGLNLLGFLFTFVIGTAWGVLRYRSDQFPSTEPFLIGFWLLYVLLAVAFARRRSEEAGMGQLARDPVDATLVFGVPLVGFGLQAALVHGFPYGSAWSAAVMALVYGVLWRVLRQRPGMSLLAEAFCTLAVGFATLTLPLACDAEWTSAGWALEGAGLVWLGCRQERRFSRYSGYLLIFAGGLIALAQLDSLAREASWLNGPLLGGVMVAAAAWLAGAASGRRNPGGPHIALLLWGLLLASATGGLTISYFVADQWQIAATVGLLAGMGALTTALAPALRWPAARLPALALSPALLVVVLVAVDRLATPLQDGGWLAWPVALLVGAASLRFDETTLPRPGRRLAHITSIWLLALLFCWILADATDRLGLGSAWPWLGGLATAGGVLGSLAMPALLSKWPARRYRREYRWLAPLPMAGATALALLIAPWASSGDSRPMSWLPLLNPLDVGWLLAAAGLLAWLRSPYPGAKLAAERGTLMAGLAILAFAWLNSLLAHGFHHWDGVAFTRDALWSDHGYQAALSLLWTTTALAAMWRATRQGWRMLWLLGAGLVALTVLKLFVIDLSAAGGLARIVSFIGVGLLLVAVGWFAPAPPAEKRK
ncbi:DUF2339 domain-containing protein [Chitinimonas arctica]|uniref:DUF2339 domain-containing protein n=1 Tax=Chitinimonas arctica TaxID=2594795 RepID=UPI0015D18D04|nr:DUF2339 domain-containing protein [Chitinimonas arctica]